MPLTPEDPVLRCVLAPEEVGGVSKDGDRGATGWARCMGAPVADCSAGGWLVFGAEAEGVVIRGAIVEEPAAAPPPPRWAIARLATNAQKPVSRNVSARRRCIIGKS